MFEDINKVLLITDMDGTFLPSNKVPLKSSLEAVEKLKNAGGKFSVATGRAIQAAEQYFEQVTVNCPIIMCNGGMVYDIGNKKQIYDVFLPEKAKDFVRDILRDNKHIGCEVLTLDGVYVPQMTEMERQHNKICKVNPILCSVDEIPKNWYKVLFAIEPQRMNELIEYVSNKGYDGVDFVRSSKEYYEILPLKITKGSALEIMRKTCGMEDYTIIAAGDYNNDIEMLKAADVGICPSNAAPDVKKAADIISEKSCEEDFISQIVDYIFNNIK